MDKNHNFFSCFVSGGFAGASIDLTLHPLDYIKTRIHRQQKLDTNFKSFYKGISASLVASFPCAATFWGVYMITRQTLSNHIESRPIIESFSSICGSFACCLVRCPFERVKQLAQSHDNSKVLNIGQLVFKQEGLRGFYKGFPALSFREVPFDTIQMLIFQTVKYLGFFGTGENALYAYGAMAGGITAFITTPVDVIKTLTMVDSAKYTGMIRGFQIFYKEHGFLALWRGWMIRTVYISLGGMMFFGVFNSCLMRFS
jgi:solute carrier family 25 S-adenosylmethionine transporter 26